MPNHPKNSLTGKLTPHSWSQIVMLPRQPQIWSRTNSSSWNITCVVMTTYKNWFNYHFHKEDMHLVQLRSGIQELVSSYKFSYFRLTSSFQTKINQTWKQLNAWEFYYASGNKITPFIKLYGYTAIEILTYYIFKTTW